MGRKVLLCGDETIGYIEHRLTPYIGTVAAEVSDHRPLLEAVLQQFFTGAADVSIHDLLMTYSIPTDVAREIQRDITHDLVSYINRGFGCIFPARVYHFQILECNDVLIEEFDPAAVSEPIENVESTPREFTGVVSQLHVPAPANAVFGPAPPFTHQRRLEARLAMYASRPPVFEEDEVVDDEDPQFRKKVACAGV